MGPETIAGSLVSEPDKVFFSSTASGKAVSSPQRRLVLSGRRGDVNVLDDLLHAAPLLSWSKVTVTRSKCYARVSFLSTYANKMRTASIHFFSRNAYVNVCVDF